LNGDGKALMTNPSPQPDMAWQLRCLLEAVKEAACGLEGRWRWLTAPLALLTWIRTRRERKEAAEAMAAVQGMLQGFLTLLEDFRAGRLKPDVDDAAPEEVVPQRVAEGLIVEFSDVGSGSGSATGTGNPGSAEEGANGAGGAVAYPSPSRCAGGRSSEESKTNPLRCSAVPQVAGSADASSRWIPAFAGMTGTVCRSLAALARPLPEGCFQKSREAPRN
jgi:hypothetical protein